MVILIGGATHTGKTAYAQKLLVKHQYPYLSIDHLKMGLIRSGQTKLTPMKDDKLMDYLWPIVREIIKTLCEYKKVKITAGAVCVDHVHLCSELPPQYSISSFMGYLKGKSALMVFDRHPEFKTRGDKEFWERGYYVETIGNIDEATVKKYIQKQIDESRKGND